jgi:hypothetical protein
VAEKRFTLRDPWYECEQCFLIGEQYGSVTQTLRAYFAVIKSHGMGIVVYILPALVL